jgi:hypothetical protein
VRLELAGTRRVVLGVEPTNAPLFGPDRDLPAPVRLLMTGEEIRTVVRIEVLPDRPTRPQTHRRRRPD